MMAMSSNHTGGGGSSNNSSTFKSTAASRDSFNTAHENSSSWEEEQHRQRQQQQQRAYQSQHHQQSSAEERHHVSPPQREPFFRFLSSPNIHQRGTNGASTVEEPVRVKIEPQAHDPPNSTSPPTNNGHGGGMAHYSYSAMARLSIAGERKEGDHMQDGRLPSIRGNGDFGIRDEQVRYAEQKQHGGRRSPSRSGESSPNLVSVKEIQDRDRYDDAGHARAKRRSGLMSPTHREDGMISLPPLRHGFVPSSPGARSGNGSINNHSESSGYGRDDGGRVTGPQRTGRPHSQSVSSMINSPYSSYSATPSATSLLLPSPSGLSLRPSFAYSPPRSTQALPGSAGPRTSDFPRLERHISSSSLPGETSTTGSSGFLRPHHSFFPNGGLNSMFTSRSGDATSHSNGDTSSRPRSPPPDSASPAPAATTARRGNIERLFRAATTRKKRSSSDATKSKVVLTMTEIKDELDDQLEGIPDGKDGKDMDPSAVRRLAHLQCEQRRRESINGGFATLRSILPETTAADSKAAILQKAINYIQNLEQAVRVSGGRLDPSMTQTPTAPSHIRAARRKRGSTLSNSFSEATGVYAGGTGEEGESMLGLEGQTARSSATDLQDMGGARAGSSRDHGDVDGDGDETMRMDMDVQDDMAMAMSDDELDDRRRSFQRHQPGLSQSQSQAQQQQQRHHEGSYSHHSQQHPPPLAPPPSSQHYNHAQSDPNPTPPATQPNAGPRKGGFSPLDLLVGVAEQARRVTGGGMGMGNGSRVSLEQQQQHQAQHQHQHAHQHQQHGHGQQGQNGQHGQQPQMTMTMGSVMDEKLSVGAGKNGTGHAGTRGSWAHIEVGDRR